MKAPFCGKTDTFLARIVDAETGVLLAQYELGPLCDPTPALVAWHEKHGKPVGTFFGTHLELWAMLSWVCVQWYPDRPDNFAEIMLEHLNRGGAIQPTKE